MNQNLTDITIVVDRSGSMGCIREDAQGGVNDFIRKQVESPGDANVTIVQFDTEYETVVQSMKTSGVGEYKYTLDPRGSTALLDAMGRAINDTGTRLAALPEAERPGLVVFVVVTDGGENASREYSSAKVQEMTKLQQEAYKWQFVYLGANQDAFAQARSMGSPAANAANYNVHNIRTAYAMAGSKVAATRGMAAAGDMAGAVSNLAWTDEERTELSK